MSDLLIERYPIHADFGAGGEVTSSGIAFDDYARMQTYRHRLAPGRRYEAPSWALNDDQTCAVITRSMEERALFRIPVSPIQGTDKERLQKAQQVLKAKEPQLVARLDGVCKRFVEAKNSGDEFATTLGILIAGIDTQIRLIDRMAEVLSGVIYFYWRVGFNSYQVAEQLGIKDAHVRQLTSRLVETGIALGYPLPQPVLTRRPTATVTNRMRAALNEGQCAEIIRLHKEGKFTAQISRELGLGADGSEIVNNVLIQAGLR